MKYFGSIEYINLLWMLLPVSGFFIYAFLKKQEAVKRIFHKKMRGKLIDSVNNSNRILKSILLISVMVLLIIGLTRPSWSPSPVEVEQMGRDVVFIIDVSKSMLSEDLKPSRLEKAKIAIYDALHVIKGDRVGLVVFAGSTVIKCPLTFDYGFFRGTVDELSINSVGLGGTRIESAVWKSLNEVFNDEEKRFKDIILITDGEDHEGDPANAAKAAGERGVRIIAIGLGDENQGKRIPVTDESGNMTFLTYNNQEVWSKLDAETLREMAGLTESGRYLNVSTGAFNLGEIYKELISNEEKRKYNNKKIEKYEEKFQIFLFAAFLLLIIEFFISERKKI